MNLIGIVLIPLKWMVYKQLIVFYTWQVAFQISNTAGIVKSVHLFVVVRFKLFSPPISGSIHHVLLEFSTLLIY